jgi:hypothetical protein
MAERGIVKGSKREMPVIGFFQLVVRTHDGAHQKRLE